MPTSQMPAYYLIMSGGTLTIISSIVILLAGTLNSYYVRFFPIFTALNQLTSFTLTIVPGLAILYFGQLFLRQPETQLQSGLVVAGLSIISLVAIVGSAVEIYVGIFFSGPPISFVGGLTGAFLSKAGASSPA